DDLARGERRCEVVVRTKAEAFDLVLLETAGREHDDRQVGLSADLLEYREPIAFRESEIQYDQVRPLRIDHRDRLVAIRCLDRGEVLPRVRARAPDDRAPGSRLLHDAA